MEQDIDLFQRSATSFGKEKVDAGNDECVETRKDDEGLVSAQGR